MEDNTPDHEKLKRELLNKFTGTSSYLGSYIKDEIQKTDFKHLKSIQKPNIIKKGDCLIVQEGAKTRPGIVVKVLSDRTIIYIALTSTENVHCLTPYKNRFFGEGCFSRSFSVCTEEYALNNFVGVFDDNKTLNKAIKDLKDFVNNSL